MKITEQMRGFVSSKIRCPAGVEDVLQETLISAWQAGTEDVKLIWRILRCRTVDAQRAGIRREKRCQSWASDLDLDNTQSSVSFADEGRSWASDLDLDNTIDASDRQVCESFGPNVDRLLALSGGYEDDVKLWMRGDAKTANERKRASRGIAKIRETVAE